MPELLYYEQLTLPDLAKLDRERTVFLWAVSPLEVHGPHLPVGADVYVATEVQRRCVVELAQRRPELQCVIIPPLYAGADALPVKGSLGVRALALESIVTSYAKGLAMQGFRYLLILDNHGGPCHGMAMGVAARTAWRKWRFAVVAPFVSLFRKMVECDPALLQATGLAPGACGDDPDNHAGTNETSLMLVAAPERISADAKTLPPSVPMPLRGGAKLVDSIGRALIPLGGKQFGSDLRHLGRILNWIGDKEMKPYLGAPALASRAAGEAMLCAHVAEAMESLDAALAGRPQRPTPELWGVRVLRRYLS